MDTNLYRYEPVEQPRDFDALCEAVFGGECPKIGVHAHLIYGTDESPRYAVVGTKPACLDVIAHLAHERVIPSTVAHATVWPTSEVFADPKQLVNV